MGQCILPTAKTETTWRVSSEEERARALPKEGGIYDDAQVVNRVACPGDFINPHGITVGIQALEQDGLGLQLTSYYITSLFIGFLIYKMEVKIPPTS